jgi:hypothetical protein
MMNLCTAQWWWLLPVTAIVGWLGGNAVVLGVFVVRDFARRPTKLTPPAKNVESLASSAQSPQPFS